MKHIPLSPPRSKTWVASTGDPLQSPSTIRAGATVTGTYAGALVEFEVLRNDGDFKPVVEVLGFPGVLGERHRALAVGDHCTIDLTLCCGFNLDGA